jgi:methylmalonyl-CoA mutase
MTEPKPLSFAADFPPATRDDWKKLVAAVLKGAPFERLESKTYDGLTLEPLYERAVAGEVIAGRAPGAAWALMQRIDHPDPASANAQALDDLTNGANGLMLVFAGSVGANGYGLDASAATLVRALDGVQFDAGISLDIDLAPFAREVPQRVAEVVKRRFDPAATNVRFGYDPLTAVAVSGKIPLPWNKTAPLMARLIQTLAEAGFKGPFAVGDGRVVHNAGGSEAQELAFALASAVAYLRALETNGMAIEAARDAIYFRLSADADQFLTMAKFRAMRKLWSSVEQTCGLPPKPAMIAAETAWRMMTRHDPHVNMLRATIAVAAAGLGGADSITALPYTAPLGLPDPFARRIARNTQLLLLEEAHLDKVSDPAAGSGALEAITQELCMAAWSLFQDIEKAGGAFAALETGMIQKSVAAVRTGRQLAVARTKDVLTGTNAFPDIHETVPAVLDVPPPPMPPEVSTAVSVTALPRIRLAEPFERLRDKSDQILAQSGARPKVFLATLGTPADFTARATFAKNFFEAAGIEALSTENGDLAALPAAFKATGTALACLCSSDKAYDREASMASQALKSAGAKHIYLAGRPGEREKALRAAGVQSFVYAGCDALATLQAAYDILDASG